MSVSVDEEDAEMQVKLQMALAFIDACDDSADSFSSSPPSNSSPNSASNGHATTSSDSDDVAGHSPTMCGAYSAVCITPDKTQQQQTRNSLQVYLQQMRMRNGKEGESRLLTGGSDNQEEEKDESDDDDDEDTKKPDD